MKRSFNCGLALLLIVIILFSGGCKKAAEAGEGDAATRGKYESAVGYLSFSMFSLVTTVYETAIAMPANGSYDPGTGWWSLSIALATGESSDVKIKFLDKNKNIQKYYNPVTTYYLLMEGESKGTMGTIGYDLEVSGVQASSTTLTINGDGDITYLGLTASYEIDNMKVKKEGAYPTSGTLTVMFNNSTVTVTYNGTQNVTGTYTFLGFSYSFTIDLHTGEIT